MPSASLRPPRVSRETRLLLVAALLAVVALWVLARLRYPPATAAPPTMAPILAPLVPRLTLDDLAQLVAEPSARAGAHLLSVRLQHDGAAQRPPGPARTAAARVTGVVAVAWLPPGSVMAAGEPDTIARDAATGLVALKAAAGASVPPVAPWEPLEPWRSRYLLRSHAYDGGVALAPVFVGPLVGAEAPLWGGAIWTIPAGTEVAPGDLVFDTGGEWAGLVVDHGTGRAVVPAQVVEQRVQALVLGASARARGTLGIDVQDLSALLRKWSGATGGAIVSAVALDGPAAGRLVLGDVLQSVDGVVLPTFDHWRRFVADLVPDRTIVLGITRAREQREVTVTAREVAAAAAPAIAPGPVGLALRLVPGEGSIVTGVDAGSSAERAGLRTGDLIVMAGGLETPTPAQVQRALRAAPPDLPVVLAIRRGAAQRLVALEPQ